MRLSPRLWLAIILCALAAPAFALAAGKAAGSGAQGTPHGPALGDASVALTADAVSRPVGRVVRLMLTLSSAGPDPLPDALVKVDLPPGLKLVSATPPGGSFGILSVATLDPGQTATLTLVTRVVHVGAQTVTAELESTAPYFTDVDSAPGNHVAGEDDQASVTVTGTPDPRPVLSRVFVRPRSFRVGGHGARLGFSVSEEATVSIGIERKRRRGGYLRVRAIGVAARRSGRQAVRFDGRLPGHALAPGRYRAVFTAYDDMERRSKPIRRSFTILSG